MKKTLGKLNILALIAEGAIFQTWGSNIFCNVIPKKGIRMCQEKDCNLLVKRKANQQQQNTCLTQRGVTPFHVNIIKQKSLSQSNRSKERRINRQHMELTLETIQRQFRREVPEQTGISPVLKAPGFSFAFIYDEILEKVNT